MKQGLRNGSLRGDGEDQRASREVGKSRRNGLKHQGKCRENPKSLKECKTRSPSALYTDRPCNTQHEAEGATGEMGPSESSGKMPCDRRKNQARFRGTRKALRYEKEPRAVQINASLSPSILSVYPPLPFLRLRGDVNLMKVSSDHPKGELDPSSGHAQVGSETEISESL